MIEWNKEEDLIPPPSVKPISPEEALNKQPEKVRTRIPSQVFQVVNELLIEKADRKYIRIYQKEIVEKLEKEHNFSGEEIFEKKWLDFERAYIDAGWQVKYDGPAYNETFQAYFEFEKKEKR